MSMFTCKMCGGNLEISNGEKVAECIYCGTKQTIPKIDDSERAALYDRANHFRRNNDFDKAMSIYEKILDQDNTDAEAYWSIVLCRYGIEYVEDPVSHKHIPTVNRAQFTSIFMDEDYKEALKNADISQKEIYETEAKAIDEIQKGILAISQNEEPFDVFICYKESDQNGKRTHDSVLANDLYHQLTQEGFKVFFARITLEDKLGTAYEPYIFAALNSAKVMVVIGTNPEYFQAPWVKNEWSRFLAQIKKGENKILIPAYKDMDPYDLPQEFSNLQAQDMTKLGFMQDLIRGIKKIVSPEPKVSSVALTTASADNNTAPLLKRVFMFLDDGDFTSAENYCEKVLDLDPENAQAYFAKVLVELNLRKSEDIVMCGENFSNLPNFKKALKYADDNYRQVLIGYGTEQKSASQYLSACQQMKEKNFSEQSFLYAAELFEKISDYKDSAELASYCRQLAKAGAVKDKDANIASVALNKIYEIKNKYLKAFNEVSPSEKEEDNQATIGATLLVIIFIFVWIKFTFVKALIAGGIFLIVYAIVFGWISVSKEENAGNIANEFESKIRGACSGLTDEQLVNIFTRITNENDDDIADIIFNLLLKTKYKGNLDSKEILCFERNQFYLKNYDNILKEIDSLPQSNSSVPEESTEQVRESALSEFAQELNIQIYSHETGDIERLVKSKDDIIFALNTISATAQSDDYAFFTVTKADGSFLQTTYNPDGRYFGIDNGNLYAYNINENTDMLDYDTALNLFMDYCNDAKTINHIKWMTMEELLEG